MCNAKIQHLDLAVIGEKHVSRRKIRMHDLAVVGVLERLAHPLHDIAGLVEWKTVGVSADQLIQVHTLEKLHGHIDHVIVTVEVEDPDDVRVRQGL